MQTHQHVANDGCEITARSHICHCACGAYRTIDTTGRPNDEGWKIPVPANEPVMADSLQAKLENALHAVLLFYEAPHWSDTQRLAWQEMTGSTEATTKVLCDTVRAALQRENAP